MHKITEIEFRHFYESDGKRKTKLLSKKEQKISRGKKESQVLKKIQIDYDGEIREREREKTKKA